MLTRTVKVTYTEEIVHDAVRTFVWRKGLTNKALWMGEAASIAFIIWMLWNGEYGWMFGVFVALTLLSPLLIVMMWIAHHRNTVGKFRRMSSRQTAFTFLDEGFEAASELGLVKLPWSSVTEIWERPDYWMIFIAPSQFITLPVQAMTLTDRDFLRSKVSPLMSRKS